VIQSMTGFAEQSFVSDSLRLKISIKSLNHRFFDWTYKGAPIGEVESRLRTFCQKKIHRGRVEVFLELVSRNPDSWTFSVNEPLLEKILSSLQRVAGRLHTPFDFSLDQVFKIPQLVELNRRELDDEEIVFIERSFAAALNDVIRLRVKEGRETGRRIRLHIQNIRRSVGRVEKQFKRQPALIQEKLKQRLKDLNHTSSHSEERLAEESAYLAQRYDLAEEIVRLKSHLRTFEELLSPKIDEPVGKKMDFLAQELSREANTSSSKSQDLEIIKESLAIKNEVESIRQHIQNIE